MEEHPRSASAVIGILTVTATDDAPLSESEDDSNGVHIVPSRKAHMTVSPMGVSLHAAVAHGFQSNDGNYCPSEGTDNDNSSAKDDIRASSSGLSSDVADVADTVMKVL
jgi:hypothetical protein